MGGVSRDIQGKSIFKALLLFNFYMYTVKFYFLKVLLNCIGFWYK